MKFRFTRDSALWTAMFVGGIATALAGHFELVTKAFPSIGLLWQSRIELAAWLAGAVAGYLRMSPLALSHGSEFAGTSDPKRTLNPLSSLGGGTGAGALLLAAALSTQACAGNSAVPREVRLKQDVLTAIDALQVLAKSVEAAVEAKPPLLTNAQANLVWDIELAAVRTLKATNGNAWAVLKVALEQMEVLPFADRIRQYVGVARLVLAALTPLPSPQARLDSRSSHWPQTWRPCVTQYAGCGVPQGVY